MVDLCYKKLLESNRYKAIIKEVPYLSRSIDMILITGDNDIFSIEFKLTNWRKAIRQAADHKNGTDKAYIYIQCNFMLE